MRFVRLFVCFFRVIFSPAQLVFTLTFYSSRSKPGLGKMAENWTQFTRRILVASAVININISGTNFCVYQYFRKILTWKMNINTFYFVHFASL